MKRDMNSVDETRSELPLWAERYARNRVLHVVLWMVGVQVIFLAICGLTLLLAKANHPVMYALSICINLSIAAVMLWVLITGRVSQALRRFTEMLYRHEGNVVPSRPNRVPSHEKVKFGTAMIGGIAGPWVLMYVLLHLFHVPLAYIQPAMAAVIVPLFTVLILVGPDSPKWPGLLMPVLYGIHAVLVLAGVPVPALGVSYLDVFIPLFVYAMLTLVVMHLYSRYALLKLQIAALTPIAPADDAEQETVHIDTFPSGGHDDD